ncbi:MAG: LuxR C-terminal-related transcriptional regulator [Burkholderiales bacterium]
MTQPPFQSVRYGHVLAAKLAPPTVNPNQVLRQSLVDKVCTSSTAKLVLMRASPGSGKSTLMAQCRQAFIEQGAATGWLNLDTSDNDPSRFLVCLTAALEARLERPVRPVQTPPPDGAPDSYPIANAALDVLDRLSSESRPYVLFLDEFDLIKDPAVLGLVRELVDQLPPSGRLVIGSRNTPDLPLSRWRARGQLLEIDVQHLRFTLDEATTFLVERRRLPLSTDDLGLLHQGTEGWVAGLWLAAVALEQQEHCSHFITRFSGSYDTVAEYLTESVLARQPPRVRQFLLHTSILKQLSVSLCQALVPDVDAASLLRDLERADLLLSSMTGEHRWYRYHSLFSGFLQSQLQKEAPQEVPRLHRLASAWYAAQQRPVPAIDHAIAAADFTSAIALMRAHAPPLVTQGRVRLLERWLGSLPPELLGQQPLLQAIQLWAVTYTSGPEGATALMRTYGLEHTEDPELLPYVLPLRPLLLAMMDRMDEALVVARECVTQLPTQSPFADAVLLSTAGSIFASMGDFSGARALLETARRRQGEKPASFQVMYAESTEGLIDVIEGRLGLARVRVRMAAMISRRGESAEDHGNAWAGALYAAALYEGNHLDAAERMMRAYEPVCRTLGGLADLMILVHVILARIAFQRGDVDRAFQLVTSLEYLGRQSRLPRVIATAKLERGRLLLYQGHADAARAELDVAEDDALWQRVARTRMIGNELEDLVIGRLRWDVTAGDAQAALPRLATAIADASAASRHLRAFKLRVLQAMALWRSGQRRSSHELLIPLLQQCHKEGFFRIIIDEGPVAGLLLNDFASAHAKGELCRVDASLADYARRLLDTFGLLSSEPAAGGKADAGPLQEPLTRKEIGVLSLVADGYSDTVMAEKLCVSINTVRSHLRNLYVKLNVHSRMQAVVTARRAGII